MSGDESKSINSQGSTFTQGEHDAGDSLSKPQEIFFSLMFPLYPQKKKSSIVFHLILWALFCIILITLGLFRIDLGTQQQTTLSKIINFVDLTSLGLSLGKNYMYLMIAVFIIVLGTLTLQIISAIFYKELIASQPWVISTTKAIVNILVRVLFIPFISTAITSFDCYSETTLNESGQEISQSFWRADNSLGCFKSVFQIVSFALSLIILVFLFIYSAIVNLLIHNHNPKNGGLFSCPNGIFNLLQGIFVFGIVFSQRLLYDWQFWRGVVGVLVPGILIIILVIQNPYYSFWSNYLCTIPWTIFASMRLSLEIGYAIEEAINSFIPQFIFLVFGGIATVILIFVIFYVMRMLEGRNWLVTSQGRLLVDINEIEQLRQQQNYNYGSSTEQNEQKPSILNNSSKCKSKLPGLPKLKDATDIEPRLRFLQDKNIRSNEYIKYADYVYTYGLKRHKKNAMLQFQYGIFLQYYCKNWVKAQSVFKLARSSNPSIPLKFVLYCKSKEGGGGQGGQGGSELTSITFLAKMAQAEDYYKRAKSGMLDFFENISRAHTNFKIIYQQLKVIIESEMKSRQCFEELLIMQPQNTTVIRDYARLILDIYNDEDTAEMIFQRAEMIEDDSIQNGTGQSGEIDQNSEIQQKYEGRERRNNKSKLIQKKKKKNKKKGGSGENIISELQGGGVDQNNAKQKQLLIGLTIIAHLLAVISSVIGTVIYLIESTSYSQQIQNLLQVCLLAGYSARLPTFGIQTLYLDIQYNFNYSGINDGQPETVPKWVTIKNAFASYGQSITDVISIIYDVTTETEPWEVTNINTYVFQVERNGSSDRSRQPVMISQEWHPSSLIRSMTNLAQMAGQLGRLNSSQPNEELQTFYSDIQYIIFNALVAILASCKRAIKSFWSETNELVNKSIMTEFAKKGNKV
ncbi:MAG: hypothetical protein EZS28_011067 [Streblomastix strix]|uniref:TmcB/TmcC TPR repeats domain-containing protein n=1 Tax=Streblomastix strix TaxID=222440 RepID=A0A5J4WEL3_9EUKA|nr:MAG: hypothetical protein EZS28_011067 [Streblomastix strix]